MIYSTHKTKTHRKTGKHYKNMRNSSGGSSDSSNDDINGSGWVFWVLVVGACIFCLAYFGKIHSSNL
jgi:hypothetical protein